MNGSIVSEIRGHVLFRDDQKVQNVRNGCSPLIFNIIYSLEVSQQLVMLPQFEEDRISPKSKKSITLNFLACISCPIGFQQIKDDTRGCDCVCDHILASHIISCNYTRETIMKKDTTAWIDTVKNTSSYLIYPHCPKDYCFPPGKTVEKSI